MHLSFSWYYTFRSILIYWESGHHQGQDSGTNQLRNHCISILQAFPFVTQKSWSGICLSDKLKLGISQLFPWRSESCILLSSSTLGHHNLNFVLQKTYLNVMNVMNNMSKRSTLQLSVTPLTSSLSITHPHITNTNIFSFSLITFFLKECFTKS